jgi:hypothetical protein
VHASTAEAENLCSSYGMAEAMPFHGFINAGGQVLPTNCRDPSLRSGRQRVVRMESVDDRGGWILTAWLGSGQVGRVKSGGQECPPHTVCSPVKTQGPSSPLRFGRDDRVLSACFAKRVGGSGKPISQGLWRCPSRIDLPAILVHIVSGWTPKKPSPRSSG